MSEAPKSSPWGQVQDAAGYVVGQWTVYRVHTAGHGGLKIPAALNALIPERWREASGWYEEDCDWSIPAALIPAIGAAMGRGDVALRILRDWRPDAYDWLHPGDAPLTGAQSRERAREEFEAATADKWVVISAVGDWAPALKASVAAGWVGVTATLGGKRGEGGERYFLVPAVEYAGRFDFGFVVDLARHPELACEKYPFDIEHKLMPSFDWQPVARDWARSMLPAAAAS